eukprot:CAMPEP_0113303028 /NCGR_PEP_ID=MMETSP0010_2-20120614/3613_1 /TAXON_ID=216773 ORGANISM="Corethron hystrix, Strain 308" /NCGR_SAMPLE_ID=MMETSP0010_2 /ASSEMBLY_ACC=CAM_ASM_000155 /LENGTH=326 /DNA_ID=CAMNT_0000156953 /DNA_START=266 /DNA_END=1242 /DNA_ORIENTATION=- /assembly_acc=CAM_ASM_000155
MLMGWFYDQPFENLRKEDAITFLAFLKFGITVEALSPNQIEELDNDICTLEREINAGVALPERGNEEKSLSCIRFNLEPLRFRHKPLVYYAITHGAQYWFNIFVKDLGFQYHETKDPSKSLGYYCRPSKESSIANLDPLVFVHGVGGIPFYSQLIKDIAKEYCGPIILLDLNFVSLRIADKVPEITDQLCCVCETLNDHFGEDTKATFVGHSYGSLILSWMIQKNPHRVANCVFLDPICFMLHEKDLLFNFHYSRVDRAAQEGKPWNTPLDINAIINLAGSEMHTNNAMLRHFWWISNEIWPEDLEKNAISAKVMLSENDDIVPSA